MDETRVIELGGRRWRVRPGAAEPLLADGWPPDHADRLTAVKRGDRRTVARFEAAGRGYYVKTFEADNPWRWLRARLGLGPGRREWDALLAARRAGLDVPTPVALALGSREALVTEEIPGGRRLDEYLFERYFAARPNDPPYPGARPPELVSVYRRRIVPAADTIDPATLAHRLAELVAKLNEADLYMPDLHPGNILISGEPGEWRLSLVDLAEAVCPAPPEAVLEHLLQLEHFFEPIASVAERLRCLGRLRELAGSAPDARTITRSTAVYRQRFYLRRDGRTRRVSKYFQRAAAGAWRGWATADWAADVEAFLARTSAASATDASGKPPLSVTLSRPEGASEGSRRGCCFSDGQQQQPQPARGGLREGRNDTVFSVPETSGAPGGSPAFLGPARLLKQGRTSTVWRVELEDGRELIAKRHNRTDRRGLAGGLLGASRSTIAFRRGHALLARGIATARPAAAMDFYAGGRRTDTLVLTEPVPDAVSLSDWLAGEPPPRLRRHVTWLLARMIQRMHDAGLAHRDLKAPNILIAGAGGPDPRPVLVDLDGLRLLRRVSGGRRVQNLMRLSVSLDEWGVARGTDRMRFLRAYLGPRGCPRPVATRGRKRGPLAAAERLYRWWHRIARASRGKMRALARKGPAK